MADPDYSDIPGFVPDYGSIPGFVPWEEPSQQQPEEPWYKKIATPGNAAAFGLSMAGDFFGALVPPLYAPISFAGGALGEGARQLLEGEDLNFPMMGVEGGLNLVPGPRIPGAGAGLKELAGYTGKSALYGAGQGLLGATPRHIAQTGQWELPSAEEAASQTAGGALFGGVTGGVLGGGHMAYNRLGHTASAPPPVEAPYAPVGDMTAYKQPDLPNLPPPPPPPVQGTWEPSQYRVPQPQNEPYHTPFNEGPQDQPFSFEPGFKQEGRPFTSPPAPSPVGGELPPTVTITHPTSAELAMLKNQGYVPIQGLRSPEGYPMMVRSDLAPLYRQEGAPPVQPSVQPTAPREAASAFAPGEVAASKDVLVPAERVGETYIANMAEGGYQPVGKSPDGRSIIFRLVNEDKGTFDPGEMWANLKRLLGRDPTPAEVEEGMNRSLKQGQLMPMEVGPTEPTGDIRQIRAQQLLGENWGETRQPEQTSMEGQMKDAEISDYLRREDATPPEMRDLSTYSPSQLAAPKNSELKHPIAQMWDARMRELDARGAPDTAYRDIMSTAGKNPLKRGETWRQRVQEGINYFESRVPVTSTEDLPQLSAPKEADEFIRMEVGKREEVLRNMQGTYAEHGARVANKELLQNAIDATPDGGKVDVKLNFQPHGKGPSITVTDDGPGLPIDMIKNEYITLTGSGKRGVGAASGRKSIGEMGVGKATYLLGTDSFEVSTVTREPDGSYWKYEFEGSADNMIGKDLKGNDIPPIKINKTYLGTDPVKTGTRVTVFDKSTSNIDAAETFLKQFSSYSDSPVEVTMSSNRYASQPTWNLNEIIPPRSTPQGQHIVSGSGPGADFSIHIPPNATWVDEANSTIAILNNRGMFQGAEGLYFSGRGQIPDRIIVDIQPTVSAQDAKNYPLTSPTRERMKGPFKDAVRAAVDTHIVEAARTKRKGDLQAAYDAMTPVVDPNTGRQLDFVTNDRGGRYTPDELNRFNGSPRVQAIAREMKTMLDRLDGLFPTEQVTRTAKFGFDLADEGKGGINARNQADPTKTAILVNLLSTIKEAGAGNPQIAAERIAHTILHEFNHNIARTEGGGFTWQFIDTDSKFGTKERADVAETIRKIITGPNGDYAPEIHQLLQEHTAARGRPDTTIDFIARQGEGGLIEKPGQGGISSDDRINGGEATRTGIDRAKDVLRRFVTEDEGTLKPSELWSGVKQATGWGQGRASKQDPKEINFIREALAFPSGLTTTGDISAPGRQGLSQIFTPQFWTAAVKMFGGISKEGFDQIDAELRSKPIFQEKIDLETGKKMKSFAAEHGMKLFTPANKPGPRAEATASKWVENIPILGKYYFQPTNRMFITFLNHLNANRTEFLLNRARDMSIQAETTGRAPMPGVLGGARIGGMDIGFSKKYNPQEAQDLNPFHNKVLAKEIVDFVNTATGHGPLRAHILPFKQGEINMEAAASALNATMFSPGLFFSRMRMLSPATYVMATPYVRKQYLKSALSMGVAWYAFTELAKNAGGDVSNDITSADFGKVRIGNTRLDPGGGFLQFLVQMGRMYQGGSTSSANQQFHQFGQGYRAETQLSNAQRFMSNKLNPAVKFAYDLLNQSENQPFHVYDRTAQLFVPLIVQDFIELGKENPDLMPLMAPIALGMGTQTYSKGESVGRLVPPESDWLAGGGGIEDLMTNEDYR